MSTRAGASNPTNPAAPRAAANASGAVWTVVGAAVLLAGVYLSGRPELDAPWIQGDEHIFIAHNPDVTGGGDAAGAPFPGGSAPDGRAPPAPRSWVSIFLHPHEDLYQPLTILSYAVEWSLWGEGRVAAMRRTDVLVHALNALLLWAGIRRLLRLFRVAGPRTESLVAWSAALIWAMHPMHTSAYAADMGRTHLLAGTFVLASLLCQLRSCDAAAVAGRADAPRNVAAWRGASVIALLLAMLNKPIVGWILPAAALEAGLRGWRAALRSWNLRATAAVCAAFALLTLWTTGRTLLREDAPMPLFGDPLARALVGLSVYVQNAVAPGPWLVAWYPPDIRTGWTYWRTWLGLGALAATALVAAQAWRPRGLRVATADGASTPHDREAEGRSSSFGLRPVTIGLVWFVATWLPVSGIVGVRVAAAQDRYFYLPLAGLLTAAAGAVARWVDRRGATRIAADVAARRERTLEEAPGTTARSAACVAAAALFAVAALPVNRGQCARLRSTLERAAAVAARHPEDPRVAELLAEAYSFGIAHETPEARRGVVIDWVEAFDRALDHAAVLAERHPQYFRDANGRAAFHRRISFELWKLGQAFEFGWGDPLRAADLYQRSLAQAKRAQAFEPHAPRTWERIAHALRALELWEETVDAYDALEGVLPEVHPDRARHLTDFGTLLLGVLGDPARARPRFQAALRCPAIRDDIRVAATIGLARCEQFVGEGITGFRLLQGVLERDPGNLDALLVVALYHLRSHHWREADESYRTILRANPIEYEALRGFHEVCGQLDRWPDAAAAWERAAALRSNERAFTSFWVWALACAGDARADAGAARLLDVDADNPFACLALMLSALRLGRVDEAVACVDRARRGAPIRDAREFERADAAIRRMQARGETGAEASLVQAAIALAVGQKDRAAERAAAYLATEPEGRWRSIAETLEHAARER